MTESTSSMAYRRAMESGLIPRVSIEVWRCMLEALPRDMSGRELDQELASQSAHKRTSDLEYNGWIRFVGVRACRVTGETAQVYEAVPEPPLVWKTKPRKLPPLDRADVAKALAHFNVIEQRCAESNTPGWEPETLRVIAYLRAYLMLALPSRAPARHASPPAPPRGDDS